MSRVPDSDDDRSCSAVAYFDAVAHDWSDRYLDRNAGGEALRERRDRVLEALDGCGGRLLDVGCGSGTMAGAVADRGFGFVGIDASPRMLQAARAGAEGACVAVAVVEALPFPDASFDVVLCMGVIGAVPDREAAIGEGQRVLRPGGSLLISFPNRVSPYALWKGYVYYPAGRAIGRVASRVTGRPAKLRRARGMALSTPASCAELLGRQGMSVAGVRYYDFNLLLSPLDTALGPIGGRVLRRLSRLGSTRLRWLGTGFIVHAVVDGFPRPGASPSESPSIDGYATTPESFPAR